MSEHISESTLADFLLERLAPSQRDAVAEHVESCPDCQQKLERLTARPSLVMDSSVTTDGGASAAGRATEPHFETELLAGRYRLIAAVGEGGMGVVWAAEQIEPVRRRVAVKVIKPGMDSVAVLRRFEAERQALAIMDHPSIARVFDGGATAEGRPYFVMEFVDGLPITQYCDDARLDIGERLQLFSQVCQAVQHAHQKGVVHRDLKPTNILVTTDNGRPVPKVIDFGVAKAVDTKLFDKSIETQFGTVVGTLEYMSPEQAGFAAADVDTRADVYSLGVILYELLTGLRPIDGKRLRAAAVGEMIRILHEEEPSKPSTRLSTADALPSVAALRQTEPRRLVTLLRGDLDWVVMKCLEKERDRRYESAAALARDVERHLADEPVEARPPSATYRAGKFLRRNRLTVIAASVVLLALVGGIVGTTAGLVQARQARAEAIDAAEREAAERVKAQEARKTAEAKEAEAKAVSNFFEQRVFAAARPKGQRGGLGKDATIRQAIAAALPSLSQDFAKQPVIEAYLRSSLGSTLHLLGEHSRAIEQLELARGLYAKCCGPDSRNVLSTENNLALSYAFSGRAAEALKMREKIAAVARRLYPDDPILLNNMQNLAVVYERLGRYADAAKTAEEVIALRRNNSPPDDPELLMVLSNTSLVYDHLNRTQEALKVREEVLAGRRRVLGPEHVDTISAVANLAESYVRCNRDAEALTLREEALAARRRVLPADHADVFRSMNAVAASYYGFKRYDEAIKLWEETLAGQSRALSPEHAETLSTRGNLSLVYDAVGRRDDAVRLREENVAAAKKSLGESHPSTAHIMFALAVSYTSLGRNEDALKLRQEALAAQRNSLPPDHPDLLRTLWACAESLTRLGRSAEAVPLIDECLTKSEGKAVDPTMVRGCLELRNQHFKKVGDLYECRVTAETAQRRISTDASGQYDIACFWGVVATMQAKEPGEDAVKLAKGAADRSMEWLRRTKAAGHKNRKQVESDSDLDSIRDRDDFKELVKSWPATDK